MKKKIICILAVATALTGLQQAQAGDKERYLLGGLLSGWILNEVADHHSSSSSIRVNSRSGSCAPVVVERHTSHRRPSGRYEYQRIKTWISAHYERVRSRCGQVETRWVPGYYETRTEKVWVSYGSSHSRSHGRGRYVSR